LILGAFRPILTRMNEPTPMQGAESRLGLLAPRDTQGAGASSASYSRFVGRMRKVLPVLVCLILAVLFFWPGITARFFGQALVKNVPNLMVEKLNLTGVDPKNRPYSLTADRALQSGNVHNIVKLEKPEGEITLDKNGWLMGRALEGELDQGNRSLVLNGEVELFHNQGYRFLTDQMNVDMRSNTAWGDKSVLFQGDFGEIRGEGFRLEKGGDLIVFKGPASAKLSLHQLKASDKPSVNHSPSR